MHDPGTRPGADPHPETPASQLSHCVHALPSSHSAPLGCAGLAEANRRSAGAGEARDILRSARVSEGGRVGSPTGALPRSPANR